MSLKILDNFNLRTKKPLDNRASVENINNIDNPFQGMITFQNSDKKFYKNVDGIYSDLFADIIQNITDNYDNTIDYVNDKIYYVNIKDFGAVGDGVVDDTTAIKNALISGASLIIIPKGLYRVTSQIIIPKGVDICGVDGMMTPRYSSVLGGWDKTQYGSVICVDWGSGASLIDNSAILMSSFTKISNLSFWYPNQSGSTTTPLQYPPTVAHVNGDSVEANNKINSTTIENVTFVNSWICMDFTRWHELLTLNNIRFCSWSKGLRIDKSYDIDRIQNVHSNPNIMYKGNWASNNVYSYQMTNNGIGIEIAKADGIMIENTFVWGYGTALLIDRIVNDANGVELTDCGFEGCNIAIKIAGQPRRIKISNVILGTANDISSGACLMITCDSLDYISEIILDKISIFSCAGQGLYINNARDLIITNSQLYNLCTNNPNFTISGIYLTNNARMIIDNVICAVNSNNVLATCVAITNCTGFAVNNIFLSGQMKVASDMYIAGSSGGKISNCFISGSSGSGIGKDGTSTTVTFDAPIIY